MLSIAPLCLSFQVYPLDTVIITSIHSGVQVRNDKARRYLTSMRKKQPVSFAQKFPNADPLALRLLQRLLAFDPKDRPTAEEVGHIISKYPSSFCVFCYVHFCAIFWQIMCD